jgi:phytoene synthase
VHQTGPQALSSIEANHALYPLRYFAWLYAPEPQRRILKALFGVESEIAGSLRSGLDHGVAHSRLQWWHGECERYANGNPVHPLTRELQAAVAAPELASFTSRADLTGFVDTAVWDLARATFESRRELAPYCERWAAAMIQPLVSDAEWGPLGAALRELQMLTELAQEGHSGRLRVPLDELEGIGVDPGALAKPPWPTPLADLLRGRHEGLRTSIASRVATIDSGRRVAARGVLVWAALACKISMRCQRQLPHSLRERRVDGIADAWSAWRVARRIRND